MKNRSNLKEFIHYVFMNVMGMIGLSCYILADTFFVSKGVGVKGLTALNLAIPVYSFIHGTGLMIGIGGATKFSIFKGQNVKKSSEKVFLNAIYIGIIMSLIFLLAGIFYSGQIALWLGADKIVFDMTKTYLKVILLFSPAFIMNNLLTCFVRNDGNPRLSMMAMLTGSFANIILDYILVFPMNMGIFGAVLATGLAPIIGIGILSFHFIKKKNTFYFVKTGVNFSYIKSIVQLGIPSLITELAAGIVILIFNIIILKIKGNVGVAAYGVVANLSIVSTSIYTGVAQGIQPLTSHAYGCNDMKSMKQIFKYAFLTVIGISVVTYAVTFIMAEPIVKIFNSENNMKMQKIATEGLKIYFIAIPFMGFNIIATMLLTSAEKAFTAQVISILRGIVIIVPMAYLMSYLAGLYGVWLTLPITEVIVAILASIIYVEKFVNLKRI